MAGNFWNSSHYQQWILEKQDLIHQRQADLEILTEDEYPKLMIFFSNLIQQLGETLKLRQQVIATATVFMKRFYARNSLKCIDPLLLAPTSVFLASKVEEFGVISNSRLISTCQTVIKNKFGYAYSQEFPFRMNHVLECEFYLLESMDCCLIVYQPYRPLVQYMQDLGAESEVLQLGWKIVNDSLRTDACLLFAPYEIALDLHNIITIDATEDRGQRTEARCSGFKIFPPGKVLDIYACMHMACVVYQKDCKQWFAELNCDLDRIMEITKYILNLYELWKSYDERKEIASILQKIPKPSTQPPQPGAR